MTEFIPHGPLEIPVHKAASARIIGQQEGRSFFEIYSDLAERCGCYVFAIRNGSGFKVWYVGKATKTFKQECFSHHKLTRYHEVLANITRGTPVMFFLEAVSSAKVARTEHISQLEKLLIQQAVRANPELMNIKSTKVEQWQIQGIVRSPGNRLSKSGRQLKSVLGM